MSVRFLHDDVVIRDSPAWIVSVLGNLHSSYEISALHNHYVHGGISYGWGGQYKIILAKANQGEAALPEWIWELMLAHAQSFCDALNERRYLLEDRQGAPIL